MSTKHTPGPWFISGTMTRYVEARIGGGGLIQEVASVGPTHADNGYGEQQLANARLIAAAPEILEALQGMVRAYEALPGAVTDKGSRHSHAVHAIRKALGEEK